ncbi:MAG: histidinol dehydrogenase, partial [Thermodesulfovibrionales bacterium]|nr:histidinol dehydrogenase [Thermodesulfovibrionales bacterium]
MRIIKKAKEISIFLSILRRRASGGGSAIERVVNSILSDVKKKGDAAVLRYTRKFDYADAKSLLFKRPEISKFADKADIKIVRALEISAKRIRRFHEMQKEESWMVRDSEYRKLPANKNTNPAFSHTLLGQMIRPIERVGVYVPGGKASYPSTVLMNVIPAQVAGVKEIVVCVPTPHGEINPY